MIISCTGNLDIKVILQNKLLVCGQCTHIAIQETTIMPLIWKVTK